MGFDFKKLGIVLSGVDGGCSGCVSTVATDVIRELNLTQEERMLLLEGVNTGALYGNYTWNEQDKFVEHDM